MTAEKTSSSALPTFSSDQQQKLQSILDKLGVDRPAQSLTVSNAEGVIFDGRSGWFDVLSKDRKAGFDDVLWFASTTKLITSVSYLQLVDDGILTLDTPLGQYYPPLASATSQVLLAIKDGQPVYEPASRPVTLGMMLTQTSGFGQEMSPLVREWKGYTEKGKGWVNSCKVENLVNTPITAQPGEKWQYGNSAEWLALIMPSILKAHNLPYTSTEDYLQAKVFKPLGMNNTTYYPFGGQFEGRLMPLRWFDEETREYEVLEGQCDLLKLPRTKEEIEYPAGGGGIYSTTTDYNRLLTHLLKLHTSTSTSTSYPSNALLSPKSLQSLFTPTLPPSALQNIIDTMNSRPPNEPALKEDELRKGEYDWSTGLGMFLTRGEGQGEGEEGRRRGGWGRRSGSVGWAGAAGTEYWIDVKAGICVVYTTQMLLPFASHVNEGKRVTEKAVYDLLEGRA